MIDSQRMTRELIACVTAQVPRAERITPHTNLLEAEILDSLLMMDLILYVEGRYGVRLEDADISPRNFRTIDCLVRLIVSKQVSPLKADCLLCRELDGFSALADLDAPSVLCDVPDIQRSEITDKSSV